MDSIKAACLIYGQDMHYVDHLAPLASLLAIPLVTPEEQVQECIQKYYPEVEVIYWDYLEIHTELVKNFDTVIYSFTKSHFQSYFAFAQDFLNKKINPIWCPHGSSDKDNLAALEQESLLLIYGKKMEDYLEKKRVQKPAFTIGNYRKHYCERHQTFYDQLIQKELSHLSPEKPNFLYAPTWQDYEGSSSFDAAFSPLLDHLPEEINLIVKLHPNMWIQNPFLLEKIFQRYEGLPNFHLIRDFTPIYPLLASMDAYIGDMSSIGYDFLSFDRPLFFLSGKKGPLQKCGRMLDPACGKELYPLMEKWRKEDRGFSSLRKKLYKYTFKNSIVTRETLGKQLSFLHEKESA